VSETQEKQHHEQAGADKSIDKKYLQHQPGLLERNAITFGKRARINGVGVMTGHGEFFE
jgi:hypothetical protein